MAQELGEEEEAQFKIFERKKGFEADQLGRKGELEDESHMRETGLPASLVLDGGK